LWNNGGGVWTPAGGFGGTYTFFDEPGMFISGSSEGSYSGMSSQISSDKPE